MGAGLCADCSVFLTVQAVRCADGAWTLEVKIAVSQIARHMTGKYPGVLHVYLTWSFILTMSYMNMY